MLEGNRPELDAQIWEENSCYAQKLWFDNTSAQESSSKGLKGKYFFMGSSFYVWQIIQRSLREKANIDCDFSLFN